MKIAIACDHAGFPLKEEIKKVLNNKSIAFIDFGCDSEDSVDYPDYAHALANAVENENFDLGILMCGSGNGINITANKHQRIRAALCWTKEIAMLARQHNNANVLTLPARFLETGEALEIVDAFLAETFEGGRHQKRVEKISC